MLDAPRGSGTFLGVTDWSAAIEDLGKRFEIVENSTKFYAACHLTHATIDAGRAIRARLDPAPEAVESVRCHVNPLVLKVANQTVTAHRARGEFSMGDCAATALVRGEAGEAQFAEGSVGERARGPGDGAGDARGRSRAPRWMRRG